MAEHTQDDKQPLVYVPLAFNLTIKAKAFTIGRPSSHQQPNCSPLVRGNYQGCGVIFTVLRNVQHNLKSFY